MQFGELIFTVLGSVHYKI